MECLVVQKVECKVQTKILISQTYVVQTRYEYVYVAPTFFDVLLDKFCVFSPNRIFKKELLNYDCSSSQFQIFNKVESYKP